MEKAIKGTKRPSITKETNARLRLLSTAVGTSIGCLVEYLCELGLANISQMTGEELKKDIRDRLARRGILHTTDRTPRKMYREEFRERCKLKKLNKT